MIVFRKIASIVLWLLAALFAWDALTVPQFAATAPAVIAIALVVAAIFTWPRKRKVTTA